MVFQPNSILTAGKILLFYFHWYFNKKKTKKDKYLFFFTTASEARCVTFQSFITSKTHTRLWCGVIVQGDASTHSYSSIVIHLRNSYTGELPSNLPTREQFSVEPKHYCLKMCFDSPEVTRIYVYELQERKIEIKIYIYIYLYMNYTEFNRTLVPVRLLYDCSNPGLTFSK